MRPSTFSEAITRVSLLLSEFEIAGIILVNHAYVLEERLSLQICETWYVFSKQIRARSPFTWPGEQHHVSFPLRSSSGLEDSLTQTAGPFARWC